MFSNAKVWFSGLMTTLVMAASAHAGLNDTPVGYWKTIDDKTGRIKSVVQIWEGSDQLLMGKVVKIFPKEGTAQNKVCTACQGELHDKPIVGMVIMSGLKENHGEWKDGKILDPENGKSYSCSVKLEDKGKKLSVHGYIGLPIIGRTQTWERMDLMGNK